MFGDAMKSDIALNIDNIFLNIRVGIIFKYQGKVLIEIRKDRVGNSVIPGGRLKIDELREAALKREIKEEMHYTLDDNKIKFIKTLEYFFDFDNKKYHELFFVYEYLMDERTYQDLLEIKENQDNFITDYIFIDYNQFDEVNLLPMEIRDIIKE